MEGSSKEHFGGFRWTRIFRCIPQFFKNRIEKSNEYDKAFHYGREITEQERDSTYAGYNRNRRRPIQVRFFVDEKELSLIKARMAQLGNDRDYLLRWRQGKSG